QYDHVLVDEFQDTNTAQYAMVNLLTATKRNLYIVGDSDQSVYRWRGADYRNVKKFENDHSDTQVILLEQNYRSTQNVLDAAMSVINKNHNRTRKQLFTERGTGTKIQVYEAYNEAEEAEYVVSTIATLIKRDELNASDMAIMYRTNAQSRPLEEVFIRGNLPYRLVGATRFYGRREVKDVIAFLRLVHNPNDTVSLQRIINVPTRGIGAKTVETLFKAAEIAQAAPSEILLDAERCKKVGGRGGIPLSEFGDVLRGWIESKSELPVAKLIDRILSDVDYNRYINDGTEEGDERWDNVIELRGVAVEYPQITLSEFLEQVALVSDQDTLTEGGGPTLLTLHAAKGLEFGTVFLVGLDEGVLPHERSFDDEESMAEERRLMYVGLTRAKDRLFITRAFRRTTYGGADVMNPSRFLADLPDHLLTGNFSKASRNSESYNRMTTWESSVKRDASKPVRLKIEDSDSKYKTGQRVKHPMFGDGMIIESKGEGDDELVTVAFEGTGIKRLMANVAELKILKG
ncbi:MAG: UvrD-helicase domain-containing protein, partial [Chloroflexi bacterium]|nr:UvrD-helicase domain-containing protein [Chloroflexota bacterium]